MVTDNYKVEVYISSQWIEGEIEIKSLSINEVLYKKLKSADSSASFSFIPSQTLYELLKTNVKSDNIPARIKKNDVVIFTGYIRRNFDINKTTKLESLKIEVVSPSFILKRKIGQNIEYKNKTVTYIINDLLTKAGLSLFTLPTISAVIPGLYIEAGKETYHALIEKMLYEYGYVLSFNKSGVFTTYKLLPDSLETTNVFDGDAGNCLNRINQKVEEEEIKHVIVDWIATKNLINPIVFTDTSNAQNGYKCYIELPPNSYLNGEEVWKADLDTIDGEILSAEGLSLDIISDADIQVLLFEPIGNKVRLSIKNTNTSVSKFIRKLDIKATSAVVKLEGTNKSIVIKEPGTEKIEEYTSSYIYSKQYGDALANLLAWYYNYSDFKYRVTSKTDFELGDIVNITDNNIGTNKVRIVEKKTNHYTDVIDYVLEAIDEYTPSEVENDYIYSPPATSGVIDSIMSSISEGNSYYRLLTSGTSLKVYPNGTIKPDILFFRAVEVNPGTGGQGQYNGIFKIIINNVVEYQSSSPEYEYYWIGESILPQDNLYPSDSLQPILDFYSDTNQDVKEVIVELWDSANSAKLDELYLSVIKDVSFNQYKIEQTIKQELPKYIGKYNQIMPTTYNRGDWFLIYGTSDSPLVRGLYIVGADLQFNKLTDDISTNGVYFLSAMSDILSVVNDGYGELSVYGNITYIENLATNTIMTNYLLGENAQFTGTVRGGTRFNTDGTINDDTKQGYILLPSGNLIASNVELSGSISVDHEYVQRGVFKSDSFYPKRFWS